MPLWKCCICCAGFCTTLCDVGNRLLGVLVGHLQIMLVRNQRPVAGPFAEWMQGESFLSVRFSGWHACETFSARVSHRPALYGPQEFGSQVRVLVPHDHVLRSWLRHIKGRFQNGPQLGE